ncbi:MAG: hypothetical protein JNN14_08320 [Comamonas sp.]|nr:hypothetical protein [Comamonas sp.]
MSAMGQDYPGGLQALMNVAPADVRSQVWNCDCTSAWCGKPLYPGELPLRT